MHPHDAAFDGTKRNKMEAWPHLLMMADLLQSKHGAMNSLLMRQEAPLKAFLRILQYEYKVIVASKNRS